MDIHITGNPGTGNTFQEIHIGTVQNYNPNATTVINHNYGDKPKVAPPADKLGSADTELCYNEDDIFGMLYYLTGKCHINWAIYDV